MQINQAAYKASYPSFSKCPDSELPEYAFIGRSNVGKSSLINMLTNNSKLAKTSSKPGKTQMLNYFIINNHWHLVDLPGYGYAKISKKHRASLRKMIEEYFVNRDELTLAFILIDIRIPPQPIDIEFINFMGMNGIPFSLIFTKADRLKPEENEASLTRFKQKLLETWAELPPYFVTSSIEGTGKEELLDYISSINKSL